MPMVFSVDYTAGQQDKTEKKVAQIGGEMSTPVVKKR